MPVRNLKDTIEPVVGTILSPVGDWPVNMPAPTPENWLYGMALY